MTLYRTIDGDMVDTICKRHYGTEAQAVAVYEANPGLAQMGPVLPKGVEINLPETATEPVRELKRLW